MIAWLCCFASPNVGLVIHDTHITRGQLGLEPGGRVWAGMLFIVFAGVCVGFYLFLFVLLSVLCSHCAHVIFIAAAAPPHSCCLHSLYYCYWCAGHPWAHPGQHSIARIIIGTSLLEYFFLPANLK